MDFPRLGKESVKPGTRPSSGTEMTCFIGRIKTAVTVAQTPHGRLRKGLVGFRFLAALRASRMEPECA